MILKEKLILEELCFKIIKRWDDILDNTNGWRQEQEISSWRLDLLNYVATEKNSESLNYVVTFIKENGPAKVYLELNDLISMYRIEKYEKSFIGRVKLSIMELLGNFNRRKTNAKEVCSNSSIRIGGSCNDNKNSRSGRGS